jgi:hypothetical protein
MATELVVGTGQLQVKIVQGQEEVGGHVTYTVYIIGQVLVGDDFIDVTAAETYNKLQDVLAAIGRLALS